MPAYNTNDMVRTIIELQKLVFDLQTEIRSNHSQVNDRLDAMEERLIGGSVTDMTPRRGNHNMALVYFDIQLTRFYNSRSDDRAIGCQKYRSFSWR